MKNPLAIILILVGLGLGIYGISQLGDSSASIKLGELELSAEDSSAKTQSYVMIGLGVICLLGGVSMAKRK